MKNVPLRSGGLEAGSQLRRMDSLGVLKSLDFSPGCTARDGLRHLGLARALAEMKRQLGSLGRSCDLTIMAT